MHCKTRIAATERLVHSSVAKQDRLRPGLPNSQDCSRRSRRHHSRTRAYCKPCRLSDLDGQGADPGSDCLQGVCGGLALPLRQPEEVEVRHDGGVAHGDVQPLLGPHVPREEADLLKCGDRSGEGWHAAGGGQPAPLHAAGLQLRHTDAHPVALQANEMRSWGPNHHPEEKITSFCTRLFRILD